MKRLILFFCLNYFFCNEIFSQTNFQFDICKTLDNAAIEAQGAKQKIFAAKNIGTHTNDNYDLTYGKFEFQLNPNVWFIQGKITYYFKPTTTTFSNMMLDCSDSLIVDSIYFHQQKQFFQQQQKDVLAISFFQLLPINQIDSVTIFYHGKPQEGKGFGSFEQRKHKGHGIIWTLSEPYGASDWVPCKQSLNDKLDSIDVYINAPDSFMSVTNGVRQTIIPQGNSTNTTHWKHRYPIATYLIGIACTNYEEYSDWDVNGSDSLRIQNFVYPENDSIAKVSTKAIINVIKFYESKVGAYPFRREKYGHAQFGWGGGQEHQTQTFVTDFGFRLIAHELAHQWFGDKSTCDSWSEIWLNEGFATYFEIMSSEYLGDYKEWLSWLWGSRERLRNIEPGSVYCDDTTNVYRIFNGDYTYNKGAWLLHMLRWQMGDSSFFNALKDYINDSKIAYGYSSTKILQQHLEQHFCKPLDTFFSIWYYGKNLPTYRVRYWKREDTIYVHTDFSSNQTTEKFWEMPLDFTLRTWQNNYRQDTTIILMNTKPSQDFKIYYPYDLGVFLFDQNTNLLAKFDVLQSPEAGYNFNKQFQITPNPTHDLIYFNQQKYHVEQLEFYDAIGKMKKEISIQNSATTNPYGNLDAINISDLNKGFYFVVAKTTDGLIFYQKLIVQ